MPIRIQSVTKGTHTVILTKNLTMTGCVVQGDDWVVWDLTVCKKPELHTDTGFGASRCAESPNRTPYQWAGTSQCAESPNYTPYQWFGASRCEQSSIHTPMMWKCDVRLK